MTRSGRRQRTWGVGAGGDEIGGQPVGHVADDAGDNAAGAEAADLGGGCKGEAGGCHFCGIGSWGPFL